VFNQTKKICGIEFKEIDLTNICVDSRDNPRLGANVVREDLKSSIRSQLARYVVLQVSLRPGETQYCLYGGGNTRFEVLQELRNEWEGGPGDNPYSVVKCMVFPWTDETDKSIMGATENIVRGQLSYAEEARAVHILNEQYQKTDLSNSGMSFLEWSKTNGMSFRLNSSASISKYLATNKYITPYMPKLMIESRAKYVVAGYLLNIKRSVYNLLRDRDTNEFNSRAVEDEAVRQANVMCETVTCEAFTACDGDVLDKKKLGQCIVDSIMALTGHISDEERRVFVADKSISLDAFASRYGIDRSIEFTEDEKQNAALLIVDALSNGEKLSAHKRTREMKKLNVSNDLKGFVDLMWRLDVGGRNMLARVLKEVP